MDDARTRLVEVLLRAVDADEDRSRRIARRAEEESRAPRWRRGFVVASLLYETVRLPLGTEKRTEATRLAVLEALGNPDHAILRENGPRGLPLFRTVLAQLKPLRVGHPGRLSPPLFDDALAREAVGALLDVQLGLATPEQRGLTEVMWAWEELEALRARLSSVLDAKGTRAGARFSRETAEVQRDLSEAYRDAWIRWRADRPGGGSVQA